MTRHLTLLGHYPGGRQSMIMWRKHYANGIRALEAGDFASARQHFGCAIKSSPQHWEAYQCRAWCILKSEKISEQNRERAKRDLRKALELGGEACPDAAAMLGHILTEEAYETEAYIDAIGYLSRAIGKSSLTNLAEEDLFVALSKFLTNSELNNNFKEAVINCQRLEEIIIAASLPRTLENGLLSEIVSTSAFCNAQLGEDSKADTGFQRLARLAPNHPRVPTTSKELSVSRLSNANNFNQPSFADIGGITVSDTFQYQLYELFRTYFGSDADATREEFRSYGRSPSRSLLLFGPSGCGKTYIIRAFCGEYLRRYNKELPLYTMRLNEILVKWVGDTEKAITRIVDEAIQNQPSIIFADEIDALGSSRDKAQSWQVSQTAHFLQEIDRLQNEAAFVLFVGCTNRIWDVDSAMLRRFEEVLAVELPNQEVRASIFDVQLGKLKANKRKNDLDTQELARLSHGLTPGDITNVVKRSIEIAQRHGSRELTQADVTSTLSQYSKPMHVRDWVQRSIHALRQAGHNEQADNVEKVYGPYIGTINVDSGTTSSDIDSTFIAEDAWEEELPYELAQIRRLRR